MNINYCKGVLLLSCLLHLYNKSADFLRPEILHPHAQAFLGTELSEQLYTLDALIESTFPEQIGGWVAIQAAKEGVFDD